jgi:hypothetical protein
MDSNNTEEGLFAPPRRRITSQRINASTLTKHTLAREKSLESGLIGSEELL